MHRWFECKFFYFLKEKLMFRSHIKSNHRVLSKNKVDTYGPPVFAQDYSATILAAKMCTDSNEQSMYIRFLWTNPTCVAPPKVAKVSKATVTGNYARSFASNFAKVKTLQNGPWLQNTMVGKGRDLLLLQETVTVVFSLKNLSNWPQHSQVNPATQMANATKRTNWAVCYKTFLRP